MALYLDCHLSGFDLLVLDLRLFDGHMGLPKNVSCGPGIFIAAAVQIHMGGGEKPAIGQVPDC